MNLSFRISKRYFLSTKRRKFINVISLISMLVVGVSTMALVVSLSVFNGLEHLLRSVYGSFDPAITLSPKQGKTFNYTSGLEEQLVQIAGIRSITEVIEDNALIKYKDTERVVQLKGVSEAFWDQQAFEQALFSGEKKLMEDSVPYAILGRGVSYALEVNLTDDFYPLQIYYPRALTTSSINPSKMFKQMNILPAGDFAVEKGYDDRLVFVPLDFMKELCSFQSERTGLEFSVEAGQRSDVINELRKTAGNDFIIQSGEEIHGDLYRILQIEKLFVFLVFGVIIAIGSVNIYFALSMIVIEKKKDMALLHALGGRKAMITRIFLYQGSMVAGVGAFSGLFLGLLICWLQQTYGLIGMGVQGAISSAYPIRIEWVDIGFSVGLILTITLLAAIQPARKASRSIQLTSIQ